MHTDRKLCFAVQNVATRPYSVLITDDDEGCRDSLDAAVRLVGYRTHLACDGYEALRIFRKEHIHIVVMDMNMPGMSGLETWRRFRAETRRVLPCVFITGDTRYVAEVDSLDEPSCALVRKPLNKNRLLEAIDSMIDRYVQVLGQ